MTTALPDFPMTTHPDMLPVRFEAPPVNPAPGGLYSTVFWTEVGTDEASRHLTGVEVRGANFPGDQVGVWDAPWCGVPALDGDRKQGERGGILDPFDPLVVWAFDSCDLTEPSRREVEQRAAQAMRLRESVVVARQFAARLLVDAADLDATPAVPDVVAALAHIEAEFAEANVVGYVHASPAWLPVFVAAQLITRAGARWTTPGGHALVFDGGYRAGLGDTIVAISAPLFGWRDVPQVRTAADERHNVYVAVAERSVLVAYEAVVAAVEIAP
ncbi:hypothetical protein [Mycolicibacterium iranicum]|uniref:Gp13 protein n=1 Tax=Mycolicibacterium iranicum TaxID=912594 RepID=A0A1X1WRB6_MYCIR|nr:hypothetical protein [Mycolicibacterium iranicum]ORV89048.1 hypothetical protein AWC12_10495 [Mycolicibacterium iranicum]